MGSRRTDRLLGIGDARALLQRHEFVASCACRLTPAPRRSSSRSPRRCAMARETSFSRRPLWGPMEPVSWPPCPASITMRLIFRPKARIRLCLPPAVAAAGCGGASSLSAFAADRLSCRRPFARRAALAAPAGRERRSPAGPGCRARAGPSSPSASGSSTRRALVRRFCARRAVLTRLSSMSTVTPWSKRRATRESNKSKYRRLGFCRRSYLIRTWRSRVSTMRVP